MSKYSEAVSTVSSLSRCQYARCECEAVEQIGSRWVCVGHKEYLETKSRQDAEHLKASRDWLVANGVVKPGMDKSTVRQSINAYRKKVANWTGTPSDEWARVLHSRFLDGEILHSCQIRLYRGALHMPETLEPLQEAA